MSGLVSNKLLQWWLTWVSWSCCGGEEFIVPYWSEQHKSIFSLELFFVSWYKKKLPTAGLWCLYLSRFRFYFFRNCQRPVWSLAVSQHMLKITNLWNFVLNRSLKLRENNERKKHPCHTRLCAFRCLISRQLKFMGNYFLKTTLIHMRGEPFLTMFYNINLSPLRVTK